MDAKSKRCQFFKRFCRLEVPLRRKRTTSLFITKHMSPWNQRTSRRNHPTPYLYWMPKQLSLDSRSYWRWIQLQIIIHPFISEDRIKWQICVFKQFLSDSSIQKIIYKNKTNWTLLGNHKYLYLHIIFNAARLTSDGLVNKIPLEKLYNILRTQLSMTLFLRNIWIKWYYCYEKKDWSYISDI